MIQKIVLSFFAIVTYSILEWVLHNIGRNTLNNVAAQQFNNTGNEYSNMQSALSGFSALDTIIIFALFIVLLALWWQPLRKLFAHISTVAIILAISVIPVQAFYETTNRTEVFYILPNMSAFYIPDSDNQNGQAKFGSVEYLKANKIAAKLFAIPHNKLSGSGGSSGIANYMGTDYYIPSGRLIVIDRTPYFQEWVDATDRGSSSKKEGFNFETKDSINVATGITASAYVTEDNAATFLYWFGTKSPVGDITKPEVQFASVIFGTSLAEVMSGVVHAKVQEALSHEFGIRTFYEAIAQKSEIMNNVIKAVRDEFAPKGITIAFMGYSGGLDFDKPVQMALNNTVISVSEKAMAENLATSLSTLQQKAFIDSIGTLASKWNGALPPWPSLLMLPNNLQEIFNNIRNPKP